MLYGDDQFPASCTATINFQLVTRHAVHAAHMARTCEKDWIGGVVISTRDSYRSNVVKLVTDRF
jgi:hypothetical protein